MREERPCRFSILALEHVLEGLVVIQAGDHVLDVLIVGAGEAPLDVVDVHADGVGDPPRVDQLALVLPAAVREPIGSWTHA
ncbi:hypothetical protein [Streptomyces sp. NBC_00009]|uniref:hypothetical protein n=1 Tax=Streptomyces sp. NBC_00009 TaxID=2975620 RepID=UPI0032461683